VNIRTYQASGYLFEFLLDLDEESRRVVIRSIPGFPMTDRPGGQE